MLNPVHIHNTNSNLGEGCVYNKLDNSLYWADIKDKKIYKYDLSSKKVFAYHFSKTISSFAFTNDERIIGTTSEGFEYLDLEKQQTKPITDPEKHKKGNRFNDGKCDTFGRYFAGTMDDDETLINGSLYCFASNKVEKKVGNLFISNGLGWNNESTKFYLTDSPQGIIYEYKYDLKTAELSERKVFVKVDKKDGFPDGLTIDSQNHIWSAHWDGWKVTRYTPDGKVDKVINMPVPRVTCCCFGGEGNDILFVTTAKFGLTPQQLQQAPLSGCIFMLNTNTTGQALNLFQNKIKNG